MVISDSFAFHKEISFDFKNKKDIAMINQLIFEL